MFDLDETHGLVGFFCFLIGILFVFLGMFLSGDTIMDNRTLDNVCADVYGVGYVYVGEDTEEGLLICRFVEEAPPEKKVGLVEQKSCDLPEPKAPDIVHKEYVKQKTVAIKKSGSCCYPSECYESLEEALTCDSDCVYMVACGTAEELGIGGGLDVKEK